MRALRVIRAILGGLLLTLSLLLLGAWILGRVASDRWLWSQYLSWMPTALVLPASLFLLGLWRAIFPHACRRRRRHARITPARGAIALAAIAIAHLVLIDLNALALVRPSRAGEFRVLFWNAANRPLEYPPTLVRAHDPDIAIITNPRWRMGREMLYTLVAEPGAKGGHVVWRHGFAIASRYPILAHGSISLGLRGVRDGMDPAREGEAAYDPGSAAFVVLDAREDLGRDITIWALDMPSDPRISRMANARAAHAAIEAWRSPEGAQGFPEPDLIVGDLNTPTGSASLRALAPTMRDSSRARVGLRGTWPRWNGWAIASLWRIDHVLHSTRWRATRWTTGDPGVGTHRMVVADLSRRD